MASNQCFAYKILKKQIGQQCEIYGRLHEKGDLGSLPGMYKESEDFNDTIPSDDVSAFFRGGVISTMACFEGYVVDLLDEAYDTILYQRKNCPGNCDDCCQLKYNHVIKRKVYVQEQTKKQTGFRTEANEANEAQRTKCFIERKSAITVDITAKQKFVDSKIQRKRSVHRRPMLLFHGWSEQYTQFFRKIKAATEKPKEDDSLLWSCRRLWQGDQDEQEGDQNGRGDQFDQDEQKGGFYIGKLFAGGNEDQQEGDQDEQEGDQDEQEGDQDEQEGDQDEQEGDQDEQEGDQDEQEGGFYIHRLFAANQDEQEGDQDGEIDFVKTIFQSGGITYYYPVNDDKISKIFFTDPVTICAMLRLFYGIRCVMGHGSAEATLIGKKGALKDFPECKKCKKLRSSCRSYTTLRDMSELSDLLDE